MTKVEHTKIYTLSIPSKKIVPSMLDAELVDKRVLVTDAELVLVNHKDLTRGEPAKLLLNDDRVCNPIIISETERKVYKGEWFYNIKSNSTFKQDMFEVLGLGNTEFKILALPEHFSPEHLQMIVDGKLKDGDKVLVECEQQFSDITITGTGGNDEYVSRGCFIKLNSSNCITLHKVEEKMYTREELISIGKKLAEYVYLNDINSNEMVEKWFEQNVK